MYRNYSAMIEAMQRKADRLSGYKPAPPINPGLWNFDFGDGLALWQTTYNDAINDGHDDATASELATTAQALADLDESFNQWFDELLTNSCK